MSAPRLVCWLLVLSVAPAAAQEWTHARSDHFEVYTTGGDRRAREALTFFERVRAFFAEVLMLAPHTDVPARLVIFSGEREFAPHRPNGAAVAYYLPAADRDYIVMRSLDADAYPLVVHEYVHLLLRHAGARYPAWLAEGLADFFSTMRLEISRVAVGVVPPGRLEYLADTGALMDLDRLFAVTHESPE